MRWPSGEMWSRTLTMSHSEAHPAHNRQRAMEYTRRMMRVDGLKFLTPILLVTAKSSKTVCRTDANILRANRFQLKSGIEGARLARFQEALRGGDVLPHKSRTIRGREKLLGQSH